MDKVRSGHDASHVTSQQLAQYLFFYLLSAIIFLNDSRTGLLQLLPILRNLRDLSKYSWGAVAFSHTYTGLDTACSRGSGNCSCVFVLDVSVIPYCFGQLDFQTF